VDGRSSLIAICNDRIRLQSASGKKATKKKGMRVRAAAKRFGRVNICWASV